MPATGVIRVVITGAPGTGKTTLLQALAAQGYPVMPESARAVIRERRAAGLPPRPAPRAFADEILRRDLAAYEASARLRGPVFFDRGVVEAIGLRHEAAALPAADVDALLRRYPVHRSVFLLPPWAAIFCSDAERDQTFDEAQAVHQRIVRWYEECGYRLHTVPEGSVAERVSHVLETLAQEIGAASDAGGPAASGSR